MERQFRTAVVRDSATLVEDAASSRSYLSAWGIRSGSSRRGRDPHELRGGRATAPSSSVGAASSARRRCGPSRSARLTPRSRRYRRTRNRIEAAATTTAPPTTRDARPDEAPSAIRARPRTAPTVGGIRKSVVMNTMTLLLEVPTGRERDGPGSAWSGVCARHPLDTSLAGPTAKGRVASGPGIRSVDARP